MAPSRFHGSINAIVGYRAITKQGWRTKDGSRGLCVAVFSRNSFAVPGPKIFRPEPPNPAAENNPR
jgi:hypothetical protein